MPAVRFGGAGSFGPTSLSLRFASSVVKPASEVCNCLKRADGETCCILSSYLVSELTSGNEPTNKFETTIICRTHLKLLFYGMLFTKSSQSIHLCLNLIAALLRNQFLHALRQPAVRQQRR